MRWLQRKCCLGNFSFVDAVPKIMSHQVAISTLFQNSSENPVQDAVTGYVNEKYVYNVHQTK